MGIGDVYGQVARKSSRPRFYHAQQHPNILIALVLFDQIFKSKMYFSFDVPVSFHQG